jgi:hypothetical protein
MSYFGPDFVDLRGVKFTSLNFESAISLLPKTINTRLPLSNPIMWKFEKENVPPKLFLLTLFWEFWGKKFMWHLWHLWLWHLWLWHVWHACDMLVTLLTRVTIVESGRDIPYGTINLQKFAHFYVLSAHYIALSRAI